MDTCNVFSKKNSFQNDFFMFRSKKFHFLAYREMVEPTGYENVGRDGLHTEGHTIKTENPSPLLVKGLRCGWAANYFPTVSRSIIVAAGLNFSVRNGKRCAPAP